MNCTFQEHAHHGHHKLSDLKKGIIITFAYFIIEFATGYLMHSLAMFGDSIHMLTDGMVLVLTFWAYKYGVCGVLDLHINKISSDLVVLNGKVLIKSHALHDTIPDLIKRQLQKEFPGFKNLHLSVETKCSP